MIDVAKSLITLVMSYCVCTNKVHTLVVNGIHDLYTKVSAAFEIRTLCFRAHSINIRVIEL